MGGLMRVILAQTPARFTDCLEFFRGGFKGFLKDRYQVSGTRNGYSADSFALSE